MTKSSAPWQDVYTRITGKIIADLEQGVRPWMKPWNDKHAAGRITKPLRHNGQPYNGINILMLWSAAVAGGYSAPIWMTFPQARDLGAHVRKGEKGELVVYANTITRTEVDDDTGEDIEHSIPFMKGYTVFNVEQIGGLPDHYYQLAEPVLDPVQRIERTESFFAATGARSATAEIKPITPSAVIAFRCRLSRRSAMPKVTMQRWHMRPHTGHDIPHGWTVITAVKSGAMKVTPAKSWLPSWAVLSWRRTLVWSWSPARIIRPISQAGLKFSSKISAQFLMLRLMRSALRII